LRIAIKVKKFVEKLFPSEASGNDSKRWITVCPYCYSTRLDLFVGGYGGKIYRCLDCGYTGSIILEVRMDDYLRLLKERKQKI